MPTNDTNITAKVICDSVNKHGNRLTTMVITYPRIILAELNTHRMLSRSTASSRAIPIKRQIAKVNDNPFIPVWIGKNQSGMQAAQELDEEDSETFKINWGLACNAMINVAERLDKLGVHKQIANRLIEPWSYVTTIISATDWMNLFKLRCHKDAQPEFMVLAFRMLEAYLNSKPLRTDIHIPFGDQMEHGLSEEEKIMVACARCARISYETHDGQRDYKEDIRLAESLIKSGHMSPFEHVARASVFDTYAGNFRGWVQQRKYIANENVVRLDLQKLWDSRPDWID